jgi:hypothetical protein
MPRDTGVVQCDTGKETKVTTLVEKGDRDSYNADTVMLKAGLADDYTAKRISLNTRGLFTFICQSFFIFIRDVRGPVSSWQLKPNRFRPYIPSCYTTSGNMLFLFWLRVQYHDFQLLKNRFDYHRPKTVSHIETLQKWQHCKFKLLVLEITRSFIFSLIVVAGSHIILCILTL